MRGDGAGEDVDGDWPPPDERSVGDDDGDDFPLPGDVSPANSFVGALDWLCPGSALRRRRFILKASL